ncbi:MAG: hypothetical protein RIQ93_1198 [Verrucomicrobiota bacterium]|jgi:putative tricarboxylic transport membrane protein
MRLKDSVTGTLLFVFGLAIVAFARAFHGAIGQKVSPALFPTIIGAGIALCGLGMVWSERKNRGVPAVTLEDWAKRPRQALTFALIIGSLLFYALVVDRAGFYPTSLVFLAGLFLAFGVRRRWIAPLSIGVTLMIHFMFYTLLHVPLPWGWLEGIAW